MKIDNLKIFSGRANPDLSAGICDCLSLTQGAAKVEAFPDTEIFAQYLETIRGDDVFIIQPTNAPTNDNFMELFIMADAAKRSSASRITAVIPFFGYARQDRKDKPRVPITAKLMANLLTAAGIDRILTMDLHAQQIQGFFDIPCDHLNASQVIIDYLSKGDLSNTTVISPDVGALKRAVAYAEQLDVPVGFIAKRRISAEEVAATNLVGDVEGRDILILDDMTETAGTITAAAQILKQNGAKTVRAAVTHACLTDTAYERLSLGYIDELIVTDSTPPSPKYKDHNITVLSIAHLFADAILRIHNNMSVTSLFKIKGF